MSAAHPLCEAVAVEATAVDGTPLAGLRWDPPVSPADGPDDAPALVLTHGVASAHDGGISVWLGPEMAARGHTVFSFDRRDARGFGGSLTFGDGLDDLASAIDAAQAQGFGRVVLVGHSKGTLYVPGYAATRADVRVAAVGLFAPVHDNREAARELLMGEHYDANVAAAVAAADAHSGVPGSGSSAAVISVATVGGPELEMTPAAFLDFFGPGARAVPLDCIGAVGVPVFTAWATTDSLTPGHFGSALVDAARSAGADINAEVIVDADPGRDPADAHRFTGLEQQAAGSFARWLRDHTQGEQR